MPRSAALAAAVEEPVVTQPLVLPKTVLEPDQVTVELPAGFGESNNRFRGLMAQVTSNIRSHAAFVRGTQALRLVTTLLSLLDSSRKAFKDYYLRMCQTIDAVYAKVGDPLKEQKDKLVESLSKWATDNPDKCSSDYATVKDDVEVVIINISRIPPDYFKEKKVQEALLAALERDAKAGRSITGTRITKIKRVQAR